VREPFEVNRVTSLSVDVIAGPSSAVRAIGASVYERRLEMLCAATVFALNPD
jgi:hypothetical protein